MKITLIYHLYQNTKNLKESLDSILNQTNKDFEILFIDDFLDEKVKEIVNKYNFSQIKSVKYVRFNQNLGHSYSYNFGTKITNNPYVFFIGSNTILNKEFIDKIENIIEKNPNVDVVSFQSNKPAIPMDNNINSINVYKEINNQFVYESSPRTKDKVLSTKFLKENNIEYKNFKYYPLVFYIQLLNNFKCWYDTKEILVEFKNPMKYAYNLYDVLYQISNVIHSKIYEESDEKFKSIIEYLIIRASLVEFLRKVFISQKNISSQNMAIKIAYQTLTSFLPKWKNNHYLKTINNGILKKYLMNFKPLFVYVKRYIGKI